MNLKKINKKTIADLAFFLERIMSAIVFIAIIVAIISLWEPFLHFWEHRAQHGAFLEFLDIVFSIVIGIEFFKLLCKPGKETLLEVLMFVVARHMIIEETSTMENLTSIITIGLLFVNLYHYGAFKDITDSLSVLVRDIDRFRRKEE